jgi:hypothetical protein
MFTLKPIPSGIYVPSYVITFLPPNGLGKVSRLSKVQNTCHENRLQPNRELCVAPWKEAVIDHIGP